MSAPIAGPMTRERFICTEISATAPVRSSRGTSVGRIALRPGAPERVRDPDREHEHDDQTVRRMRVPRDGREPERQRALQHLHADEQAAPIDPVGEQAADHRQEQQRPELAEVEQTRRRSRCGSGRGRRRPG